MKMRLLLSFSKGHENSWAQNETCSLALKKKAMCLPLSTLPTQNLSIPLPGVTRINLIMLFIAI